MTTTSNTELVQSVSIGRLTDLLQASGYRVTSSEQNGQTQLLSAAQGVGFAVRFGNPAAEEGHYLDYTLSCALRVQGELPDELVPQWNSTKRFARLTRQSDFLVLEMDVVVAGGVSEAHLRATAEIWDRLLQQFLLFLRNFSASSDVSGALAEPVDVPQASDTPNAEQAVDAEDEAEHGA
ncbi:MAG: hypothetical protein CML16_14735 [Pusillimonas sp.]|nr:hypothetical protein [Pusillimonas sp.]MBC40771.1 hypothetical protein [Pusillimonas sp.]HCP78135.1 hypothetical protein [Pusillimonas sp.]|tara:strand:- start:2775 stop:3314 length:540 start_codon:yes stop_codon:yes gene_type:complete